MSEFRKVKEEFYNDHHIEIHEFGTTGEFGYRCERGGRGWPGPKFYSSINKALKAAKADIDIGGKYS